MESFWRKFLLDVSLFENCVFVTKEGCRYSTHKVLAARYKFLKGLLSTIDHEEESVLLLPDHSLEEVEEAMQYDVYSTDGENKSELMKLLERCHSNLLVDKPEEQDKQEQSAEMDVKAELDSTPFVPVAPTEVVAKKSRARSSRTTKRNTFLEDFVVPDNVVTSDEAENEEDAMEEEEGEEEDENKSENKESTKIKGGTPRRKGGMEKNYMCHFCDKGFSIQKYLDSHITNKHPDKCEINSLVLHQNGCFKCSLCLKSFNIARRCRYHLKFKHKVGASLKCDVCSKLFYYEYDLKLHMKFHTDERSYVCDLCGKGFLMPHLLANHRQSLHASREEKEKGRRFVCTFCAKGFFSKSALQEHEFLHSEKKNFGCDACGMTFKQSSGLRAHHNRHHSELGPKPITEEHKEKMRAYMKRYRAIRAGKLPDDIKHTYRTTKKNKTGKTECDDSPAEQQRHEIIITYPVEEPLKTSAHFQHGATFTRTLPYLE